jgi:hypothetical protein
VSYVDCLSRISTLDSLMRSMDPAWATSGYSMLGGDTALTGTSFDGVLQSIDGGTAGANAMTASPAFGIARYTKPNVLRSSSSSLSSAVFENPLPGSRETQAFGPSSETLEPSATVGGVTYAHYHNGIDLAAPLGTTVRAAGAGTVTYAGRQSDGAVVVKIRHPDGYTSLYAHLDPSLQVSAGDRVAAGQAIGQVGMTGNTTGPHLHFGLYTSGGTAIDPTTYLAAGRLPDPATLLAPSPTDPSLLTEQSGSDVLARFDAVSSQIPYQAEIRSAAVASGIDPLLLASLVWNESNFHADAVSRCGAMGLTQLMPRTAASLGVTDGFDPQQNLNGGAEYIARQLRGFGRVDLALAAYNAGPGAVGRLGAVPDGKERYVSRILNKWTSYTEAAA